MEDSVFFSCALWCKNAEPAITSRSFSVVCPYCRPPHYGREVRHARGRGNETLQKKHRSRRIRRNFLVPILVALEVWDQAGGRVRKSSISAGTLRCWARIMHAHLSLLVFPFESDTFCFNVRAVWNHAGGATRLYKETSKPPNKTKLFCFYTRRTRGVRSSGRAGEKKSSISAGTLRCWVRIMHAHCTLCCLFSLLTATLCVSTSRPYEIMRVVRREVLQKKPH